VRSNRHVALLRGVNIAGTARVAMSDLRALFEGLGFRDVRTVLNSGNVIFSMPARGRGDVAARIERAFASKLDLSASVVILSAREVGVVVRDNPLTKVATNPSHLLVLVPRMAPDLAQLKPLLDQRWAPEMLALGARVAYLWCPNGLARSPVWTAVDRAFNRRSTARNIATFTKIMGLVEEPAS
jgi:uncharacterized protein (DUF1697 family)